MGEVIHDRLGLDAGAKVLVQHLKLMRGGRFASDQIRKVYGDDCEAVIVVVPRGQGVIFEHRLSRELGLIETGED